MATTCHPELNSFDLCVRGNTHKQRKRKENEISLALAIHSFAHRRDLFPAINDLSLLTMDCCPSKTKHQLPPTARRLIQVTDYSRNLCGVQNHRYVDANYAEYLSCWENYRDLRYMLLVDYDMKQTITVRLFHKFVTIVYDAPVQQDAHKPVRTYQDGPLRRYFPSCTDVRPYIIGNLRRRV